MGLMDAGFGQPTVNLRAMAISGFKIPKHGGHIGLLTSCALEKYQRAYRCCMSVIIHHV